MDKAKVIEGVSIREVRFSVLAICICRRLNYPLGLFALLQVWVEIAQLLVELGRFAPAKFLLKEARRHALAFDDAFCLSMQRRVMRRIAHLEGMCAAKKHNHLHPTQLTGLVLFCLRDRKPQARARDGMAR